MISVRCAGLFWLLLAGCGEHARSTPAATGRVATPALVAVLQTLWPAADWGPVAALGPGQSCAFTLDAAGLHARVSGGTTPTLRLDGEPARILESLGPRLDEWQRQAAVQLVASSPGGAITGAMATRLCNEVLDACRQVDRVQAFVLATDAAGKGFEAELRLTPRAGSWLDQVVRTMGRDVTLVPVPHSAEPAAILRVGPLRVSLLQLLSTWSGPELDPLTVATAPVLQLLLRGPDAMPEAAWVLGGTPGGLCSIIRCRDRAEVERLFQGLREAPRQVPPDGTATAPLAGADFEHRGVRAVQQHLELTVPPGRSVSYHALVGEWLLMGSDTQRLGGLIDDALDGRLRAAPLPDGALAELRLPVAAALRGGPLPLPARMQLTLGRDSGALVVRLRED